MHLPNIFSPSVCEELIERIENLSPDSPAQWGRMNASQMLAHCNVSYEYVYEPEKFKKPGVFKKMILNLLVKPKVVSEAAYSPNSTTGPDFKINDERDFDKEKARLIAYINKVQQEGANAFDGRESFSFGPLSTEEWNNMFYKHLDHHLRQFFV